MAAVDNTSLKKEEEKKFIKKIYPILKWLNSYRKQLAPMIIFIAVLIFLAIEAKRLPNPTQELLDGNGGILSFADPQSGLPLGTSQEGFDWYAILIHSTINSLKIGTFSAVVCIIIALFFGLVGPFIGGVVDDVFQLVTNIFLVFPVLPFIILLSTLYQGSNMFTVILVIALFNWSWAARSIRSQVLSLKEREFVKLSKITGLGPLQITFADIVPSMGSYLFLVVTIIISVSILVESGISILGLGPQNIWTLGKMLERDRNAHVLKGYNHLWVPTGLTLGFLSMMLYIINARMNEIFNPRLREK